MDHSPPDPRELLRSPEVDAFERLKPRLTALWTEVFPRDDEHYTSVVVPSVTLEPGELERHPETLHHEEALLFLLIRLRNPRARVIYLTSLQVSPVVMDYYFQFLAGIPISHARARLTLLSAHDASLRPLSEKILERPRLIERIRAAIPDASRAYLTVFRSTPLERRLAVLLDIPLNAADPGMDSLCTKSGARRILRESGIEVPLGREDLRTEAEILEALVFLRRQRPSIRHAVLKLNTSYWDEGHALVRYPSGDSIEDLRGALQGISVSVPRDGAESFLARYAQIGGVVEALVEGVERRTASTQIRINPVGTVVLTSTHEELRGGPIGMATRGCVFPADDAYRSRLQEAGLRVGRALADRRLVGRVSVEFLVWREQPGGDWQLAGTEINLGFGGTTHPLLAVRFLSEGRLDPETGLFRSPTKRLKFYRATDHLESGAFKGLLPEDLIDILTLRQLHYSQRSETGALFYMLGALSEYGRVGVVAVGNSRSEADSVYQRTREALEQETGGTIRSA